MAFIEAGIAERLKQGAMAAVISLAVAVYPLPAAANNVRVEDVDNPSMQAGQAAKELHFSTVCQILPIPWDWQCMTLLIQ